MSLGPIADPRSLQDGPQPCATGRLLSRVSSLPISSSPPPPQGPSEEETYTLHLASLAPGPPDSTPAPDPSKERPFPALEPGDLLANQLPLTSCLLGLCGELASCSSLSWLGSCLALLLLRTGLGTTLEEVLVSLVEQWRRRRGALTVLVWLRDRAIGKAVPSTCWPGLSCLVDHLPASAPARLDLSLLVLDQVLLHLRRPLEAS